MIKFHYDPEHNAVVIEFAGHIDVAQVERYYPEMLKVIPKGVKGFKLLTDFTLVEEMDAQVQGIIKKIMDILNERGVTEIIRVVPDPEKDFGFNIMSAFHYSKKVKIVVLPSREEAEEQLKSEGPWSGKKR